MEIKTKFNIYDIVQHKFQKNVSKERGVDGYEILEIITQTCYAGTQIFYQCRPFFKLYKKDYTRDIGNVNTLIDILHGEKMDIRLREDELKECPQDLIDFMKNTP